MAVAVGISIEAVTPVFALCLIGSVIGDSSIDTADVGYQVYCHSSLLLSMVTFLPTYRSSIR